MTDEPVLVRVLTGISWRLVRWIRYAGSEEDETIHGITGWYRGVNITVSAETDDLAGTVIHELCHAILGQIVSEYRFTGDAVDDESSHGPLFRTLEREIRRVYDHHDGGPR